MNFSLILRAVKDIFHLPIRHCRIQLLHITEFLDGNHCAVRTVWQRYLSITVTIFFGSEEWDGPLSLFEMMDVSDHLIRIKSHFMQVFCRFSGLFQFAVLLTNFPLHQVQVNS